MQSRKYEVEITSIMQPPTPEYLQLIIEKITGDIASVKEVKT